MNMFNIRNHVLARFARIKYLRFISIVALASILRPSIASVSPIIANISGRFGLSQIMTTTLLTIPVFCFAIFGGISVLFLNKFGRQRTGSIIIIIILTGEAVRINGGVLELFSGTLIASAGIAMGNVFLPIVAKEWFPTNAGIITSAYTTALNGMAALAAAFSVPLLKSALGWRGSLGIWIIPGLLALFIWLAKQDTGTEKGRGERKILSFRRIINDPVAWALAGYMGCQSFGFYSIISWLPAILNANGISTKMSGVLLSVTALCAIPSAITVPWLAAKYVDQRRVLSVVIFILMLGYGGVAFDASSYPLLWAFLIGMGQGSAFPLGMTLIVLRAASASEAIILSAFAQTVGYSVAIFGPLILGVLRQMTGSWEISAVCLFIVTFPAMGFGLIAARRGVVGAVGDALP